MFSLWHYWCRLNNLGLPSLATLSCPPVTGRPKCLRLFHTKVLHFTFTKDKVTDCHTCGEYQAFTRCSCSWCSCSLLICTRYIHLLNTNDWLLLFCQYCRLCYNHWFSVMGKSKSWFDINHDWITGDDFIWVQKIWFGNMWFDLDLNRSQLSVIWAKE